MNSFLVPLVLGIGLVGLVPRALPAASPEARPATIVVHLPTDAKLTIDGQPTQSTSAIRSFVTPPLKPGIKYHLTFKAQFVRGHKTLTMAQDVPLWAGQETDVSLDVPGLTSVSFAPQAGPTENGVSSGHPSWDFPDPKPFWEFDPMKGYGPPGKYAYGHIPR